MIFITKYILSFVLFINSLMVEVYYLEIVLKKTLSNSRQIFKTNKDFRTLQNLL